MLGEFSIGQKIDLSVIFVSRVTGEIFDPINPTVEITHFEGLNEVIDLPETPVIKVSSRPVGYYTLDFTIPNTFIKNILYFTRWRGEDPCSCTPGVDVSEDHFMIVDNTGSCSPCGLVPRFCGC
jgi:hypothetical protein